MHHTKYMRFLSKWEHIRINNDSITPAAITYMKKLLSCKKTPVVEKKRHEKHNIQTLS